MRQGRRENLLGAEPERTRDLWRPLSRGIVLVLVLTSCASYDKETSAARDEFQGGRFNEALAKLESGPIAKSRLSRLLYLLEKAMILDRMDQLKASRKLLIEADDLSRALFTKSISKEALTYVYNDTAQEYAGEDYEKVAIHTMAALSFLESENKKSALVEARRINTLLTEINAQYEERKNGYSEDAFARYLAGLIYESTGRLDDAIISYAEALGTYETTYKRLFATPPPDSLLVRYKRVLKQRNRVAKLKVFEKAYPGIPNDTAKAHLVVVHEIGLIARKQPEEFLIPFGSQIIRLSFPIIRPNQRPSSYGLGLILNGEQMNTIDLVQNMDSIASETLEDRRLRLVLKQGARLLVKGQITEQARQNFGPLGGLAANIYSAVTETADTRSWSLLPSHFYISQHSVVPGEITYQFKNDGRLSGKKKINLSPGDFVILRNKPS